jgi:hypothetical protein
MEREKEVTPPLFYYRLSSFGSLYKIGFDVIGRRSNKLHRPPTRPQRISCNRQVDFNIPAFMESSAIAGAVDPPLSEPLHAFLRNSALLYPF